MTNSSAPLPTTTEGINLLLQLHQRPGDTLYGMAMSSQAGDDRATTILASHILNQQKNSFTHKSVGIKTIYDRSKLAADYASDAKVPKPLRELFAKATGLTVQIAAEHANDFRVASPDAHHFAASFNGAGSWDINTKTLAQLPRTLHFATLLMNPVNPVQPAVNERSNRKVELPLEDGRLARQAAVIADVSGLSVADIAKGALANAMHIAAWRYGKPITQEQVAIGHFLKVARIANQVAEADWDDKLFIKAIRAVEPKVA